MAFAAVSTVAAGVVPAAASVTAAASRPPAQAAHGAALDARIRAAAAAPAPVVTDSVRPGGKRGLRAPSASSSMARANALKQARALRFLQARWARSHPGAKCTLAQCLRGMPAARDLAGTQQAQIYNFFCGPATVSEMLAQMRVRLSQPAAARELGTTSGTDWSNNSGYPVPRVLNRNQRRNSYVAVPLPWTPTALQVTTFKADLVANVNYNGGAPIAGNAYEVPGGPHLVGHPAGSTIMHWFDIRGYSRSGAITNYEDSVHGASSIGWAAAVPAYSSLPSVAIVDITGARGYVW
jgi:hypothetical protein